MRVVFTLFHVICCVLSVADCALYMLCIVYVVYASFMMCRVSCGMRCILCVCCIVWCVMLYVVRVTTIGVVCIVYDLCCSVYDMLYMSYNASAVGCDVVVCLTMVVYILRCMHWLLHVTQYIVCI